MVHANRMCSRPYGAPFLDGLREDRVGRCVGVYVRGAEVRPVCVCGGGGGGG